MEQDAFETITYHVSPSVENTLTEIYDYVLSNGDKVGVYYKWPAGTIRIDLPIDLAVYNEMQELPELNKTFLTTQDLDENDINWEVFNLGGAVDIGYSANPDNKFYTQDKVDAIVNAIEEDIPEIKIYHDFIDYVENVADAQLDYHCILMLSPPKVERAV